MGSWCAAALVGLIAVRTSDARAEPPMRSWEAPATCPSAATAWTALEALLGDRAHEQGAQVRIEPTPDGRWRAAIRVGDAATERVLVARECDALTAAAAVVIAVASDPVGVAVHQDRETAPLEIPVAPTEDVVATPDVDHGDPRREATVVAPRSPNREPLHHILRGGAMVGWSAFPAVSGGPQLGYALGRKHWRVEAVATYVIPRTIAYADGAGGRFQAWLGGVQACAVPGKRVSVPLCAGLEAGGVRGRGRRVVDTRVPTALALNAVATSALVIAVRPRLFVRVGADLVVALARAQFHVGERAVLVEAPQVGARVGAGVEWRVR